MQPDCIHTFGDLGEGGGEERAGKEGAAAPQLEIIRSVARLVQRLWPLFLGVQSVPKDLRPMHFLIRERMWRFLPPRLGLTCLVPGLMGGPISYPTPKA